MQPDKAGTAPAFPADHLAGTKADRVMGTKDGLTAWKAIGLLFPETERLAGYPYEALYSFIGLLREDSWYATGYRVSSVEPERILCKLWDILEIDLDSNTASSRVLEYEGLQFFAADAPAVSFATKTDLRRAYDTRVESERKLTGHAPTAKADEAWGKGHGLSREKMRELRANSPARKDEDRRKGARKHKLAD